MHEYQQRRFSQRMKRMEIDVHSHGIHRPMATSSPIGRGNDYDVLLYLNHG